jgi:hypothetical protein
MPGLVPGIHVLQRCSKKDVDGRDRPGHDGKTRSRNLRKTLSTTPWIKCGKPVDDLVEKPVHMGCRSAERTCVKAGYVPCITLCTTLAFADE